MYNEDELLPISALQHWLFCPRQCGLIHLEIIWNENRLTAQGRLLHERVHTERSENQPGLRTVCHLQLHSFQLGLCGQADVVEFHLSQTGIMLPEAQGLWQPFPVEYKRGKPKKDDSDRVQLCAQAMCLEEMLQVPVPEGAFFYARPRRRTTVQFDQNLREKIILTARQLHEMFAQKKTPTVRYHKKCDNCSLYQQCLPKTTGPKKKIDLYMENAFHPPRELADYETTS